MASGFCISIKQKIAVQNYKKHLNITRQIMAKNVVVIGTQWGDEGKGKIVDWLSERGINSIDEFLTKENCASLEEYYNKQK